MVLFNVPSLGESTLLDERVYMLFAMVPVDTRHVPDTAARRTRRVATWQRSQGGHRDNELMTSHLSTFAIGTSYLPDPALPRDESRHVVQFALSVVKQI